MIDGNKVTAKRMLEAYLTSVLLERSSKKLRIELSALVTGQIQRPTLATIAQIELHLSGIEALQGVMNEALSREVEHR